MNREEAIFNNDWLRVVVWDVWQWDDGKPTLVNDLSGLFSALHASDVGPQAQRRALEHFMSLPAAGAMPDALRQEVIEWLANY